MENFINTFNRLDINLYLPVFLFMLLTYIAKGINRKEYYVKYMYLAFTFLGLNLIYEASLYTIFLLREEMFRDYLTIIFSIYYLLQLVYTLFISKFLIYFICNDYKPTKPHIVSYAVPFALGVLILISNIFTGNMFYIDDFNISFGYSYMLFVGVIGCFMLNIAFHALKNIKTITWKEIVSVIYLQGLTIVFLLLQANGSIYESALPTQAMAAIVFLIVAQDMLISHDSLTKAYTRYYFEQKIDSYTKKGFDDYILAFIDMDDFRSINTMYGRKEGNLALAAFSNIVLESLPHPHIFVRYGGDEFIICLYTKDMDEAKNILDNIYSNVEAYNNTSNKEYAINYSYSYEQYDSNLYSSPSTLIHLIDSKMYNKKLEKKQKKRI